jgi:hypothetical protein
LDFNTFVIAGPNTVTASLIWLTGGSVTTAAGTAASSATNCQTDIFSITGVTGGNPPVICGTNTGYHGTRHIHKTSYANFYVLKYLSQPYLTYSMPFKQVF